MMVVSVGDNDPIFCPTADFQWVKNHTVPFVIALRLRQGIELLQQTWQGWLRWLRRLERIRRTWLSNR